MPAFPVYRSPHWDKTELEREQEVVEVAEQNGFELKLVDGFREAGGRHWVKQLAVHWKLGDMKQADIASLLGITPGQISKFLSDSSTSIKVIALLAARLGVPLPPPCPKQLAYAGISYALPLYELLNRPLVFRPSRTPKAPSLDWAAVGLLLALSEARLHLKWHSLTVRYEHDLFEAADDPEFRKFVGSLAKQYQTVTQGVPNVRHKLPIYFPDGEISPGSRLAMCKDLDTLWRRFHFFWECVWRSTDTLTPWGCPPL